MFRLDKRSTLGLASSFYNVNSGFVLVLVSSHRGKTYSLGHFGATENFFLPKNATVYPLVQSSITMIKDKTADIADTMTARMADRLINDKLETHFNLLNTMRQLVHYDEIILRDRDGHMLDLPTTEVAKIVNRTREQVTRSFEKLIKMGYVEPIKLTKQYRKFKLLNSRKDDDSI